MTDVTAAVPVDVGHPLAPYFPRLAIEWIRSDPERLHQELQGTIAFVDISGFTKLSERLARLGKSGAEELTATIDTCFVTLLDLAVANGGRLLKFGGDALLVYFSGEAHEARACLAAIEMRRALRVVGRLIVLGQKVSLRMSVGVHSGLFNFFLVGESHREFVVTGPGASAVVEMEGTADAGEIVISDATAAALSAGARRPGEGPGSSAAESPVAARSRPSSPSSRSIRRSTCARASRSGSAPPSSRGPSPSTARSPWPSSTTTERIASSPSRGPRRPPANSTSW